MSGFCAGVFVRSVYSFGLAPIIFVLVLAAICAGARYAQPRRVYSLGAVFFVLLACGMFRAQLADTPLPPSFAAQLSENVTYTGTVASDPDVRDADQLVTVAVSQGNESTKILAIAPLYPSVAVGEQVSLAGVLAVPAPFATDGGRTFAYDKYLQKDGVRFEIMRATLAELTPAPWYSPASFFAKIKHAFMNGLDAALPEPAASLAAGIVIGGKSGLGRELQDAFVRSGLVQIVVLSGYNVMVVASGVMAALSYFRAPRRLAVILGAVALVCFVLAAGLSATAIRAMLMALIALYARATARSYVTGRALLAVVFLMLVWNPLLLAYDPGFDLSVAATAGLIWLAPFIERKLVKIKNEFWRTAFATTLAAQIAVWPLLLYETGDLSLVSIPANILTMPVVPLAMTAAAIAGVSGVFFGPFASIIAFPAYLAVGYIIAVAQAASALPFAAFVMPAFPFVFVIAAYAALIYIAAAKRSSMTDQFTFSKKASI